MASDDPTLGNRPPSPTQYQRAGRDSGTSLMRIARWFVLFVYSIAIIATVVLAITVFLRLFGANTSAPFVEWVYRSADRFMQPFRGIFPPVEVSDRSVLDVAVLFGILMYGLFAVAVHALVEWLDRKLYVASYPPQVPGGSRHLDLSTGAVVEGSRGSNFGTSGWCWTSLAVHPHGMTPDKASANEGDHVARGIRLRDRHGVSAIVLGSEPTRFVSPDACRRSVNHLDEPP